MKLALLFAGGLVAYLLIGSGLFWWTYDRVPIILIMMFNYALAAVIFGPLLMLLPQRDRSNQ